MADKKESSKVDVPVWEKDTPISVWKRELKIWKMGTTVPKTAQASHVTLKALPKGTDRRERAMEWLLSHENEATSENGLDLLVEYLRTETEGLSRDVRLRLINQLFALRRGDSQAVQSFLTTMDTHLTRLREVGIQMNPTIHVPRASFAEAWQPRESLYMKEKDGEGNDVFSEVNLPRDLLISDGNYTKEDVIARLDKCAEYEELFQEILFTTTLQATRLTPSDNKTILSKLDNNAEKMTFGTLCKEVRIMYPLQVERERNAAKGKIRHRGYLSGVPEVDPDGHTYEDSEDAGEDSCGDSTEFELPECALESVDQEAFFSKYKVSYDNKKSVFRVKPKAKARAAAKVSERKTNPVDRKTGQIIKCDYQNCGSIYHMRDFHKSGGGKPKAKGKKKATPKRGGKKHAARLTAAEEEEEEFQEVDEE